MSLNRFPFFHEPSAADKVLAGAQKLDISISKLCGRTIATVKLEAEVWTGQSTDDDDDDTDVISRKFTADQHREVFDFVRKLMGEFQNAATKEEEGGGE